MISIFYHMNEGTIKFVFIIMIILSILFTIGYYSRYVGIVLFFLFANLMTANPYVVHAVEFMLEVSLFWALFLPLDHNFAVKKTKFSQDTLIMKVASFGILFQIFLIYLTSVLTKSGEYWRKGIVIESATDDLTFGYWLAPYLADLPQICQLLTYGSLVLEFFIAFCIFFPFKNPTFRFLAAISIPILHFSIGTAMYVGPFFLSTLCFAAILIPSFFWKKTKYKKWAFKPIVPPKLPVRYFSLALMGFAIFLMIHKNLFKWQKESYISGFVQNIPLINKFAAWPNNRPGIFLGVWDQPWYFFAPDPYKDMGTIIMVGRDQSGQMKELLLDRPFKYTKDNEGNVIFDQPLNNAFTKSRFVYSFYARRLLKKFPRSAIKKWLAKEEKYKNKNGRRIQQAKCFYYSNQTSYENGQFKRERKLFELASYP